ANAIGQQLFPDATYSDDYVGGTVITITGLLPEDRVNFHGAPGVFWLDRFGVYTEVVINGVAVAYSSDFTSLGFTFYTTATSAHVEAFLRALRFMSATDSPTATRDIIVTITDTWGDHAVTTGWEPHGGVDNPFNGIDIYNSGSAGGYGAPALIDVDADGDLDL